MALDARLALLALLTREPEVPFKIVSLAKLRICGLCQSQATVGRDRDGFDGHSVAQA